VAPSQAVMPSTVTVGPRGDEVLQYIEQLEGDLLDTRAG